MAINTVVEVKYTQHDITRLKKMGAILTGECIFLD